MRNVKKLSKYVTNISVKGNSCTDRDIIVEHRSNNSKRDFLFVNRLQCKHIPASPSYTIKMCKALANLINHSCNKSSRVVVIGFAETGTGIATLVARALGKKCIGFFNTTREDIADELTVDRVYFLEEHSHAPEQKLYIQGRQREDYLLTMQVDILRATHIVFVDDEISTGKTVLNFIDALNNKYKLDDKVHFSVASICNWQDEQNKKLFQSKGISRYSLISGELIDKNMKMLSSTNTSKHIKLHGIESVPALTHDNCGESTTVKITDNCDLFKRIRGGCTYETLKVIEKYLHSVQFAIMNDCAFYNATSIRIIGTEEFMFIPMLLACMLETYGFDVICHASTRSKIDVMEGCEYGEAGTIKQGYAVHSAYSKDRQTYIYNMSEPTDYTFILTDSPYREYVDNFVNDIRTISIGTSDHIKCYMFV